MGPGCNAGKLCRRYMAIMALGLMFWPGAPCAGETGKPGSAIGQQQGWSFGESEDRRAAIWIKGIRAEEISNNARPKIKRKNAADTSNGINAALSRAEKKSAAGVGLKMKNETSSWKVAPTQSGLRQDETMVREGKHVLGAYAGVKASDNLNISVGPELIIKDEQNVSESANTSQPDTALGLGMNFKLDF